MKTEPIFEPIAYREYLIQGQDNKVSVVLGKPQKDPNSADFYCPYKISVAKKETTRSLFGVDGFQAMHLALKTIDAELRRISKDKELTWMGGTFSNLPFPE